MSMYTNTVSVLRQFQTVTVQDERRAGQAGGDHQARGPQPGLPQPEAAHHRRGVLPGLQARLPPRQVPLIQQGHKVL